MSLQRALKPWIAAVAAALLLAVLAVPASAGDYKAKDLKGTYHFVVTEARTEAGPPEVEYCDSFGTIVFDGVSKAYTTMEVRRCTKFPTDPLEVEIHTDELGEFEYEVFENGEFLMTELDTDFDPPIPTTYRTHGRILQRGRLLLVDGTRGCEAVPCPHPEFLQTIAIAAKE